MVMLTRQRELYLFFASDVVVTQPIKRKRKEIDLFGDMASILNFEFFPIFNSIVSNTQDWMLLGRISMYLSPKQRLFETIEFKMGA